MMHLEKKKRGKMKKDKLDIKSVEAISVSDIIAFIDRFLPIIVFAIGILAFILMMKASFSLEATVGSGIAVSTGLNARADFYRGMAFMSLVFTIYITYKIAKLKQTKKK